MIDINDYDYDLPKELVALEPANPRDSARLFVYDTSSDTITFDYFRNVANYLPQDSIMVLNNTKVVPSRITMYKENGGKVIALLLVNELQPNDTQIKAIIDRKVVVEDKLIVDNLQFIVHSQSEHIFTLSFDFEQEKLLKLLEEKGEMPIPLYLKKTPLQREDLMTRYQTLFAQNSGSSAAPTASLHFTEEVFKQIDRKGIERLYITLHVGMGTFAPLDENTIKSGKLHTEYYEIPIQTQSKIKDLRSQNKKVVAVGTTVVRTLESFAKTRESSGPTDMFIKPPYDFQLVDHLITNFHVPKSSLMMLVDAFLKHKLAKRGIVDLYKVAIEERFRFFSFGDAMLIL